MDDETREPTGTTDGDAETFSPSSPEEYARLPEPARRIVARLGMAKIPHEGPWFVETWRSPDRVEGALAARYDGPRIAGTAILALITDESFSALHRLATDELWHFHAGAPLELFTIGADGRDECVTLGADLLGGEHPQRRVPAGTWMAARPLGGQEAWTLIGNTLAPGFEFADYEAGEREALIRLCPAQAARIRACTRD